MCGIFGYVGARSAAPIIIEGLRSLEYRGYDSAGLYVPGSEVCKVEGPVEGLAKKCSASVNGSSGIGHTRWATHGVPSVQNAHPHCDMSETIWLVHNGIIENFLELKESLVAQGVSFHSDTDSEVLAKLIGTHFRGDLLKAVRSALLLVRGAYGIAVMSERNSREIVVARFGSPIVLGLGSDGNFVASDAAALIPHTKDVVYLADGDIAVVQAQTYAVLSAAGVPQTRTMERVEWEVGTMQKQGFEHFMLKEIFEAPTVIENTIRGRLLDERGRAKLGGLETALSPLSAVTNLAIVGCGSAYYAGLVGRSMLEEYAYLPAMVELGSEYRNKPLFPAVQQALLAVSQSGETADTLASIQRAKEMGLLTLGIVNTVGSSIARETTAGVYNHAGPEVAVASTKAFISQLTVFALLTLFLGRERGMSLAVGQEIVAALRGLPEQLDQVLTRASEIEAVAEKYAVCRDFMYIGRKAHAAVALEGALKMKEVTYTHAEGYPAGELKHGPIAMLDEEFPVAALAPRDAVYEKMVSNIQEVRTRKAPVIAIATEGDKAILEIASDVIYVPSVHPLLQPIISTVPLQLLAYYVAVKKGLNVDRPRNLAKSVTVE